MALQTQDLVMAGLSVLQDNPPNRLQPPLVDGIHLRWTFTRERGFPWYGYYLFRRLHHSADPAKVKLDGTNLQPGSTTLNSAEGQLTSDSTLALTNFVPTGDTGFDLDRRSYLRFIPSELASRIAVRIGFLQQAEIKITASFKKIPVAQVDVKGQAGQNLTVPLEFDAISAIEFSPGEAVLLELRFVPVASGDLVGWLPVPNFPYPMCLPVANAKKYPCSGAPANQSAAEKMALDRVLYGLPGNWAGANFTDLHDQLLNLVDGGPGSTPMAERITPPPSPPPQPSMPRQYPLDLILLGALHPAIAQMVGLYWVDQDKRVILNDSYDYLIVADHKGTLGNTADDALRWLGLNGFDDVDAFIVFNKSLKEPSVSLDAPSGLKTYALPGGSMHPQIGSSPQPENNVGLRWNLGVTRLGTLLPGKSVMYHLWRADLGNNENPTAPGSYDVITKSGPVLVVEPAGPPGKPPKRPADWPPERLHYLDNDLADGWYSYQVSGVDIFGRHSKNSPPGPWYQWTPTPDPRPWYFKDPPSADSIVHPSAVRLLDMLPPPTPTGIEAYALDPADPTVLKDAAYNTWWNSLTASSWFQALTEDAQKDLIGLRVRWLWTHTHMRQAPDTHEFRIYYHPDPINVLLGKILSVTAANAKESDVATSFTIPNLPPPNAYKGLWLQVGNDAFKVVSSQAGNPLRLRVTNIGSKNDVQPQPNVPCVLAIPEGHASFVDYSIATNWQERYYVVDYNAQVTQTLLLALDPKGNKLGGSAAVVSRTTVSLDGAPDLSEIQLTGEHLFLANDTNRSDKTYPITAVDDLAKTVTVDGTPNAGRASSEWEIVFPLRTYEVFLPAAVDAYRAGLPLATTLAEPITYAHVSVSAADDKTYISDKRTTGRWGQRSGNEGSVGARAKIFRVRRELPLAPALPPADSDKVYATSADYHSHSFYTFRWIPISDVKTHIFRALDESIFAVDWEKPTRLTLDPNNNTDHRKLFPAQASEPRWDTLKCQQVANELNALNTLKTSGADKATALVEYRKLSNDALRVLAGLPGNERAFSQLTIQPLDPDDPANADRRGLDNAGIYTPNTGWRAYVDTLDGRSTNCYFYRAGSVDGAHNRSKDLSPSSPAVYCPDIVPPRAPVITKVFAGDPDPTIPGDKKITLKWASNREPDLKEYRVYRAGTESSARDLRLMTQVTIVAATQPTPAEVTWTDVSVPGLVTFHYRIVAVDSTGNRSEPSRATAARAFDDTRPEPPVWNASSPGPNPGEIVLSWTSPVANFSCLAQRQVSGATDWESITRWLPRGIYTYTDTTRVPGLTYAYRLKVRDSTGQSNRDFLIQLV